MTELTLHFHDLHYANGFFIRLMKIVALKQNRNHKLMQTASTNYSI